MSFFGVVMSLIGHRYQAVPAVLETGNPKRHKGLFGMSFDQMQVYCPTFGVRQSTRTIVIDAVQTLSKHKFIPWLKSEGYQAYLALSTLQRLTMKPVLFCRVAASSNNTVDLTQGSARLPRWPAQVSPRTLCSMSRAKTMIDDWGHSGAYRKLNKPERGDSK